MRALTFVIVMLISGAASAADPTMYCDGGSYLQIQKDGFFISYEDPEAGEPPVPAGLYRDWTILKLTHVRGEKVYKVFGGKWGTYTPC